MLNTKKAFTLVELIVVITILAILGTIAFISLQWYSSDARNTKRTNDINSIGGSVNIKSTKGSSLLSFVGDNSADLTGVSIAGTGVLAGNSEYKAWIPNYTALEIKSEDFKDPNGDEYLIWATIRKLGKFEVAATIENWAWSATAAINGNYSSRTSSGYNLTSTWSDLDNKDLITLEDSSINLILKGDTVTLVDSWAIDTAGTYKITKVSADWKKLTLDSAITAWLDVTQVRLTNAESTWIIVSTTATTTPVTNGSINVPY